MADDENSTETSDYWWKTIDPHWRLADTLTVLQAAALIAGVEPSMVRLSLDQSVARIGVPWERCYDKDCHERRLTAVFEALRNAVNGLMLYADIHHVAGMRAWDRTTVSVADLTAWLAEKSIRPEFFFPNEGADVPGYLDPKHPRYAPKLAAAVRAWEAVSDPGVTSPKEALKRWLEKNAAELGLTNDGKPNNSGIEEVAKVANWQPSGGAPKTPGG